VYTLLLFTRGWVTFVQAFPLPEILSARLAEDFGFLKTLPLDYPPNRLPAVKPAGQLTPIARSERLGLHGHASTETLYRCIAPHYPVQIAPEMGIEVRVNGLQFSETKLRVYIHTFGLVLSLQTVSEATPGSDGLTGFAMARILNNLERNRGVRATTQAFRQVKCVLDIFYQLYRVTVSRIFPDKVPSRTADVFCVFSPDSGEYPASPDGLPDGQPDRLALFSALGRYTHRENPDPVLGNKCFTSEANVSEENDSPGWIFGSEKGVALFVRPGVKDSHATRARRCYHKNVARLIGWYLLYQAYLAEHAESPDETDKRVLQHAVDSRDTMAVKYSTVWIRWARQRFGMDEPVKAVVEAYGLKRTHSPDNYVGPMQQAPPSFEVTPLLNFDTFPSALCLAMPGQVESLVTFTLSNQTSDPVSVQLSCKLEEYSGDTEQPIEVKPGNTQSIEMKVSLITEKAAALKMAENGVVTVRWTVEKAGVAQPQKSQTFNVNILQKDYFVFARRHKGSAFVNCSWLIAAWVNEEDLQVIDLRHSAASKNPKGVPGYSSGDPAAVLDQVKALYAALHDKKLLYGNRTLPQYQDENHFGQTVRLPGKSIADGIMNCLDGAVLFASLLAACDLDPGILFIPGHAVVGWKHSHSPGSDWEFLDITDVVESDFQTALENGRKAYNEFQERVVEVRDLQPREIKELEQAAILVDIRSVWSCGVKTLPA
jgi:hypothetical protein